MNLKEQTVYIPKEKIKSGKNWYEIYSNSRSKDRDKQIVAEKMELICLSKEELIGLLEIAWQGGKDFENAGWNNQEYVMGLPEIPKEQFINQLIDNTKQ